MALGLLAFPVKLLALMMAKLLAIAEGISDRVEMWVSMTREPADVQSIAFTERADNNVPHTH
jgi:hypothetical protein